MFRRFLRSGDEMFVPVPLDPASVKAADDREYREKRASSSVVSIRVETPEQIRQREFWEEVDGRQRKRSKVRAFPRREVRA